MKQRKPQEPYEVMPEGEPHAVADWLTLAITLLAIVFAIASLACSNSAEASEGRNWCADWQEGYEPSFYIKCTSCQSIDPKPCPEPEYHGQDGYLKGVKDGAADGKEKQKEMQK